MNPRLTLAALLGVAFPLASSLWAHPGHGSSAPHSLLHHATEWVHAGPWWMAIAAAAAAGLAWRIKQQLT